MKSYKSSQFNDFEEIEGWDVHNIELNCENSLRKLHLSTSNSANSEKILNQRNIQPYTTKYNKTKKFNTITRYSTETCRNTGSTESNKTKTKLLNYQKEKFPIKFPNIKKNIEQIQKIYEEKISNKNKKFATDPFGNNISPQVIDINKQFNDEVTGFKEKIIEKLKNTTKSNTRQNTNTEINYDSYEDIHLQDIDEILIFLQNFDGLPESDIKREITEEMQVDKFSKRNLKKIKKKLINKTQNPNNQDFLQIMIKSSEEINANKGQSQKSKIKHSEQILKVIDQIALKYKNRSKRKKYYKSARINTEPLQNNVDNYQKKGTPKTKNTENQNTLLNDNSDRDCMRKLKIRSSNLCNSLNFLTDFNYNPRESFEKNKDLYLRKSCDGSLLNNLKNLDDIYPENLQFGFTGKQKQQSNVGNILKKNKKMLIGSTNDVVQFTDDIRKIIKKTKLVNFKKTHNFDVQNKYNLRSSHNNVNESKISNNKSPSSSRYAPRKFESTLLLNYDINEAKSKKKSLFAKKERFLGQSADNINLLQNDTNGDKKHLLNYKRSPTHLDHSEKSLNKSIYKDPDNSYLQDKSEDTPLNKKITKIKNPFNLKLNKTANKSFVETRYSLNQEKNLLNFSEVENTLLNLNDDNSLLLDFKRPIEKHSDNIEKQHKHYQKNLKTRYERIDRSKIIDEKFDLKSNNKKDPIKLEVSSFLNSQLLENNRKKYKNKIDIKRHEQTEQNVNLKTSTKQDKKTALLDNYQLCNNIESIIKNNTYADHRNQMHPLTTHSSRIYNFEENQCFIDKKSTQQRYKEANNFVSRQTRLKGHQIDNFNNVPINKSKQYSIIKSNSVDANYK